jgi:TPR repeat protein
MRGSSMTAFLCLAVSLSIVRPARSNVTKPVVAVFDIENRGTKLSADAITSLSDFLATELAATGAFETVPRDEIKRRLDVQKKDSYRACFAQSCQIELGQELAAQKSLSTQLMRLGKKCLVTTTLYDLRRAIAEHGATADGACDEDAVVALVKEVVQKLVRPPDALEPSPARDVGTVVNASVSTNEVGSEVTQYRHDCDAGELSSCIKLGDAYRNGLGGLKHDETQAAALYKKACEGNLGRGCFSYGWMVKYGVGTEKNPTLSARLLDRACTIGDFAACTELALSFETGQGTRQSSKRAFELYTKACDGNYAWGCGGVGWMYKYGHGTDVDYARAGASLERACDGGDMGGCSELAGLHQAGLGRAQNSKRAIELYQKSCEGGWSFGCGGLGWMYKYGYGVPLDYVRANHFLDIGCTKGDYGACHELASLFQSGAGVSKDPEHAGELLRLACDHGFRESCKQLRD